MLDFLIIFSVITFSLNYSLRSSGYRGPRSDHFDGRHFHNISLGKQHFKPTENPISEFIIFMSKKLDNKRWRPRAVPHGGTLPAERVLGGSIVATFINHATVLIQTEGVNIITDPVWAGRASPFGHLGPKRYMDPGISLKNLPPIDLILLTHNHYDHCDIDTMKKIMTRDTPALYTTLGNSAYLALRGIRGGVDMDWGETVKFSAEISIECVPAQHFSARAVSDRNKTLWAGFVIRTPHGNIYCAGDTGYGPFVQRIQKLYPDGFRFALLPIGAFEPRTFMRTVHMGPLEAVQVYRELKIEHALAIHFGTFDLALDGQDDPAEYLRTVLLHPEHAGIHFEAVENGGVVKIG